MRSLQSATTSYQHASLSCCRLGVVAFIYCEVARTRGQMSDMIYLFNSGRRDRYRVNLLNTLFLPIGATNQYRYTAHGPRVNVRADDRKALLEAPSGSSAVVMFIDRYAGEYKYYPLRNAELVSCKSDNDRIYVVVRLGEWIWPNSPDTFSERVLKQLQHFGIPQLRDGNPDRVDDGFYAFAAPSAFADTGHFEYGDAAWHGAAAFLASTHALGDRDGEHTILARATLLNDDGTATIRSSVGGDTAHFHVRRGQRFRLDINYRFPAQALATPGRATMELRPSANLEVLSTSAIQLTTTSDRVIVPLLPRRSGEDHAAVLRFDYPAAGGSTSATVAPDAAIAFDVSESRTFWIGAVMALLLFAVGGLLTAAPSPVPQQADGIVSLLGSRWIVKVIGVGLQVIAALIVLKWVGKKLW